MLHKSTVREEGCSFSGVKCLLIHTRTLCTFDTDEDLRTKAPGTRSTVEPALDIRTELTVEEPAKLPSLIV
jgi:hypothetical protein